MSFAVVDRSRESLAKAVRDRVAGPEFEAHHARIWFRPGARWFSEADPIWRVHADTAMFAGGIRALLLQSLHPVAMYAVSQHSGFRGDAWGRLQRTSRFLATTTYGTIEDAERAIAVVRAVHRKVRGTMPDGTPYRADDPELLSWIHVAEVDSFLATHTQFGTDPLTQTERDTYVRQTGEIAHRLGVLDPPTDEPALARQLAGFRPRLRWTEQARDASDLLLRDPPVTGLERLGYGVLAAGAVSTLPAWVRTELALPTLPIIDRLLSRPLTRSVLRTMRWALVA